jgi:hypothetical protein
MDEIKLDEYFFGYLTTLLGTITYSWLKWNMQPIPKGEELNQRVEAYFTVSFWQSPEKCERGHNKNYIRKSINWVTFRTSYLQNTSLQHDVPYGSAVRNRLS